METKKKLRQAAAKMKVLSISLPPHIYEDVFRVAKEQGTDAVNLVRPLIYQLLKQKARDDMESEAFIAQSKNGAKFKSVGRDVAVNFFSKIFENMKSESPDLYRELVDELTQKHR